MNDLLESLTPAVNDCLLIIDVQNDFCENGALAVPNGDDVVELINTLSERFSTVVATQDWHPRNHASFATQHSGKQPFDTIKMPYGDQTLWPDHCVQSTTGAQFHPKLDQRVFQNIIRKGFRDHIDSNSAFFENDQTTTTGLSGYLKERGIKRVFCAGLAYDFCVRFSAEDARKEGFETVVLTDACRSIDMEGSKNAATEALESAGVSLL